eukprot:COSAG02_NODE_7979_length_2759_cov_1.745113_3_plen_37_part_00
MRGVQFISEFYILHTIPTQPVKLLLGQVDSQNQAPV